MTPPRELEIAGDLASLPESATGASHMVWWGNIGFMLIEGTGFALAAAVYLYLMTQGTNWPLPGDRLPGLLWSGLFTAGLLLSQIPNIWVLHCARGKHLAGIRLGVALMAIATFALLVLRGFEFTQLNVPWHHDAYGSAIWLLLVLHTTHVVTDWVETVVIAIWLFTHEVGDDQFADVEDNSNYWTFVVLCWLPLYALLYWAPRAL